MTKQSSRQLDLGGPLYKTTFDHLVAETGVSPEDLHDWSELGFLSFMPDRRARYGDTQIVEVKFIASLVRVGLSRPMIHNMLRGLSRPYCYDPFKTCYNFATGEWHPAEGASMETLRRSIRDRMLDKEIANILTEAVRDRDVNRIESLRRLASEALAKVGGAVETR